MKKRILLGAVLAGAGIGIYSCGGSSTGSGTVALYATDAPLDGASRVEVGIKEIRLENTGTGDSCVVFAPQSPYRVDLTDLQGTMQLLDVSSCPAVPYNRLVVTMEQSPVDVIKDGNSYVCSLTDYNHEADATLPNRTVCDQNAGECYIYVSGAVNILANQTTDVALDFSVKDSEIEIDSTTNPPTCTVAFKVYPLHAKEVDDHMKKEGKEHEIKGVIVDGSLDTSANTFQLRHGDMTFDVSYDDSIAQGVDQILQLADDHDLRVEVECSSFDLSTATCTAEEIEVKVEGTALNVDSTAKTLDIDLNGDGNPEISPITLSSGGEWEGDIQDGSEVEAEITGHDGSSYIADEVEAEKH